MILCHNELDMQLNTIAKTIDLLFCFGKDLADIKTSRRNKI